MSSVFLRLLPVVLGVSVLAPVGWGAEAEPVPSAPVSPASAAAEGVVDGAPVVVWGRTLAVYRLRLEFPDVERRARATAARIDDLLGEIDPDHLTVQDVTIGPASGFVILSGSHFLLSFMEGDLNPASGEGLGQVAQRVADEIRVLVRDHAAQHNVALLVRAIVEAVVATVVFAGFWMVVLWVRTRLLRRAIRGTREAKHKLMAFGYDWRPVLFGFTIFTTRLITLSVVLIGAYAWVTYVLSRFPYTRRWADQLGSYLVSAIGNLAAGAVHQIPNLIALGVIYLLTRGLIRILNGWFTAIESGRYFTVWLDQEAARATRRLTNIAVIVVAIIVAFPYLPGSQSDAFRGISVFLGLMVSLGGAGFVGQIIGGLAAVYSRAVRTGDFIVVGDTQGIVKDLGLLSTKVVTRTREEVTIPNSLLMTSAVRNFSRNHSNATILTTGVTIGYDTPWRQVEAMLLEAAARTDGLAKEPQPRVLQTALDDFYVRYELNACAETPYVRAEALARLHGHIQDVFYEHNVQIMSPHYRDQPPAPVVVARDRWHSKPAVPPATESGS